MGVQRVYCSLFTSGVAWGFSVFTVACSVQVWHGGSACLLLPVQFRCGMGVQRVNCCLFSSVQVWHGGSACLLLPI